MGSSTDRSSIKLVFPTFECVYLRCGLESQVVNRAGWKHRDLRLRHAEPAERPGKYMGGSFGFGYDSLSRRTSLTRPNGVNTNYSYDSLSRLLGVLHQTGVTTLDGKLHVRQCRKSYQQDQLSQRDHRELHVRSAIRLIVATA